MLRIIHKATEQVTHQKRVAESRREKALAWMQQQQEADRIKALAKHADKIEALKNKKAR